MAQTYSDRFMVILAKLIEETIEVEKETAVSYFITEPAPHNHRVGVIAGLRKALDLMDDAESVLLGRERSK
jgi:hypothetical protein